VPNSLRRRFGRVAILTVMAAATPPFRERIFEMKFFGRLFILYISKQLLRITERQLDRLYRYLFVSRE
jgi:hypothetical protein